MEEMRENTQGISTTQSATMDVQVKKNFFRDFFGIISDPIKTYNNIIKANYWVVIFLVVLIGSTLIAQSYLPQFSDYTIKGLQEREGMQKAIEMYQNPSIARVFLLIGSLFGMGIWLLLITLLSFFVASIIFGGTAKFGGVWMVTCWAGVISFISGIVKAILIIIKNDFTAGINLGLIFSEDMAGVKLHKAFATIDIFGIWHFVVLGIGLAALYKFTTKKGITISFLIWLLLSIIGGAVAFFS